MTMSYLLAAVINVAEPDRRGFVDGECLPGSGEMLEMVAPATEQVMADFAEAPPHDSNMSWRKKPGVIGTDKHRSRLVKIHRREYGLEINR